MLSTFLSSAQHQTTWRPSTHILNFARAAEKKQVLVQFFASSHHIVVHQRLLKECVPGEDMEISCSPALSESLSCVLTWCVVSSCHRSPGHFGYVCMFSVTKDQITTETAYGLTLHLLLPNPRVEHERPLNETYCAPLTGSLQKFHYKFLYFF